MSVTFLKRAEGLRSWTSYHKASSSLLAAYLGRRASSNAATAHQQKPPRHETTCFEYLRDVPLYQDQRPFNLVQPSLEASKGRHTSNLVWKREGPQEITDIRGQESNYELDKHGFAVRYWPTKLSQHHFDDPDIIERDYLPEISKLFTTTVKGANLVVNTHFQRRRLSKGDPKGSHPHVDVSAEYVYGSIHQLFAADAERLLAGRVRVFNTWRPTFDVPILDQPLALCDGSTVDAKSLIECTHVDQEGRETYNLYQTYDKRSRWYYLSRQVKDEVLLFKHFDSADVPAKCSPHATFPSASVPAGHPSRESIETKVYVFTDPEPKTG